MKRRSGFTLVEMLVVIGIIVILASLVLAFYPKRENVAAREEAGKIEQVLVGAKMRALRENRPIGVRFLSDDGGRTFHSLQLIETPLPLAPINPGGTNGAQTIFLDLPSGNGIQAANNNPNQAVVGNTARQVGRSLQGEVFVGDHLQIVEVTESTHKIVAIDYATNTMTLAAHKELFDLNNNGIFEPAIGDFYFTHGVPNVNATNSARLPNNYRYLRGPRPLMGEQPHKLALDVVILGNLGSVPTSRNMPIGPSGNFEIIFSPSGQVLNASAGRVDLWVADTNNIGKPRIVSIYAQTGFIAGHPVGPAGNEFSFTQDGKASGQ